MQSLRNTGSPPKVRKVRATCSRAIGITSTGNGNLPKHSTSFDLSTIQINFDAIEVKIFSRVKQAPPPLIILKLGSTSSAPSI